MNRYSMRLNILRRNLLRCGVGFIGAGFLQVLLETKAKGFTNSQKLQLLTSDSQTKQSTNGSGLIHFGTDQFKDFDAEQAYCLARLIDRVYNEFNRENKDDDNSFLSEDFRLIKKLFSGDINEESGFIGFIAINEKNKKIFIIFRGTENDDEWFDNINISLRNYISLENKSWGQVHSGFYSIYRGNKENSIGKDIEETLKKLKDEYDHIFVAGHSLGGALATLTIPDLIDSGINQHRITVYTFGSPRCCNNELANMLNDSGVKHWRINNTEDFIVSLPWAPTPKREKYLLKYLPLYQHTGIPISFTIGHGNLPQNHNLQETYMEGISQPKIDSNDHLMTR